jgi:hypothetical protein
MELLSGEFWGLIIFVSILCGIAWYSFFPTEEWEILKIIEVDSFGFYAFSEMRRKLPPNQRVRLIKPIPEDNENFCACEVWVLEQRISEKKQWD